MNKGQGAMGPVDDGNRQESEVRRAFSFSAIFSVWVIACLLVAGVILFFVYQAITKALEEREARAVQRLKEEAEKRAKREKANKAVSRRFLDNFFKALRQERFDDAYAMTTTAYQERVGKEAFLLFIRRYPPLTTDHPLLVDDNSTDDEDLPSYQYNWTLNLPGATAEIVVVVVLVGNDWKVEQLGTPKR